MASSKVYCMLVSLLLLVLVLSDMDTAMGEPNQLRNRKLISFSLSRFEEQFPKLKGLIEKREWVKKPLDLLGAIPPPPPSSDCDKKDDACKRLLEFGKGQ